MKNNEPSRKEITELVFSAVLPGKDTMQVTVMSNEKKHSVWLVFNRSCLHNSYGVEDRESREYVKLSEVLNR